MVFARAGRALTSELSLQPHCVFLQRVCKRYHLKNWEDMKQQISNINNYTQNFGLVLNQAW